MNPSISATPRQDTRAALVAAVAAHRGGVRLARQHGLTGAVEQERVDGLVARLVAHDAVTEAATKEHP